MCTATVMATATLTGTVTATFERPDWVVKGALLITLILVVIEFVTGHLSHSLALVSDGWHNLTDLPSLVLAWIALYFERKPPDHQKTYGYQRAGVLTAFVNSLLLVGVAIFICYEGYERILNPEPIATNAMLVVGVVALVINGSISLVTGAGPQRFEPARGLHSQPGRRAFQHCPHRRSLADS